MSQDEIRLDAIVLSRDPTGEDHLKYFLFCPENGKVLALDRIAKKTFKPTLDLFDIASFILSKSRQGNSFFIKEFKIQRSHKNLAKNYKALQHACSWSNLMLSNLQHLEDFSEIHELTLKALHAWEALPHPDATYLKTLYLFIKKEGLPIDQDWIKRLSKEEKELTKKILSTPLEALSLEKDEITPLISSLQLWLKNNSHLAGIV